MDALTPQHPIYIVSKGRADTRLTSRALERMGVEYRIVVEAHERDTYAAVIDPSKILVLDPAYQREYDTCDTLGDSKSKGPGAARNFAWAHALSLGARWHWVMDDNIRRFYRFTHNQQVQVLGGACFRAMEDFCERYENVLMAGPNYKMFAKRKQLIPPFITNTRIYSCNLIRNDAPFRWRARYNEDTDLSLRMLKAGYCTVQFNAFLQEKIRTQTLSGGCTTEFYAKEGTGPKSRLLLELHPDVTRIVYKFGRIHHYVDYRPFKRNALVRKPGATIGEGIDDYGMRLALLEREASHG